MCWFRRYAIEWFVDDRSTRLRQNQRSYGLYSYGPTTSIPILTQVGVSKIDFSQKLTKWCRIIFYVRAFQRYEVCLVWTMSYYRLLRCKLRLSGQNYQSHSLIENWLVFLAWEPHFSTQKSIMPLSKLGIPHIIGKHWPARKRFRVLSILWKTIDFLEPHGREYWDGRSI